jgi:hypothetical protein
VTAAADRRAELPEGFDRRLDHIARARVSLAEEMRRLEQIGFELPLARCREERRYWDFLGALHAMAGPAAARVPPALREWSGGR